MKQLVIIFLLASLMLGCKSEPNQVCTISGKVSHYDAKELYMTLDGLKDTLRVNEDGIFYKEFAVTSPMDGILQGTNIYLYLYFEPGKNLEVNFDATAFDSTVAFGGNLALPNEYLHEKTVLGSEQQKRFYKIYKPPYTPADFMSTRDSLSRVEYAFLDKFKVDHYGFSKTFYEREKRALEYRVYFDIYGYPRMVGPDIQDTTKVPAGWYDFMDKLNLDDPSLLEIRWCMYFINLYVGAESLKKAKIPTKGCSDNPDWLRAEFAFVKEKFTALEFFDVILFHILVQYMDNEGLGTAGIEDLVTEYLSKSTNEKLKKNLQQLCDKWAPIASGHPAPNFILPDNKGHNVSLSDFKGKFVFIDFWFTGCGPCKVDIPYLKQILDDYKDRNIVFISISVDKKKSDWEKMLIEGYIEDNKQVLFEEKTNWIHLHDPQIREVAKNYLVSGYPTYTLIDPDGKFVNARCENPARPNKLRILLDAQQGL